MTQSAQGTSSVPDAPASVDLMKMLEERVTRLVDRHRESRAAIDELRARIQERDQKIRELESMVQSLGQLREEVQKRIDGLIAEIDRIEAPAAQPSAQA